MGSSGTRLCMAAVSSSDAISELELKNSEHSPYCYACFYHIEPRYIIMIMILCIFSTCTKLFDMRDMLEMIDTFDMPYMLDTLDTPDTHM